MAGERRNRGRGRRRVLAVLALLAGTVLAVRVLYDSSDELFAAADDLTDLAPGWVGVAVAAEALCYLARGAAQRQLLSSGARSSTSADPPPRIGTIVLAATTLAGDAVAYCLPFGFAAAGVVTLRVLRRRRVGEVLAGWMFGVATLLYVGVLAVLGIVAAQLAGNDGLVPGLQELSAVVLAGLIGIVLVAIALRRWAPSSLSRWVRVQRRITVRRLTRDPSGPSAAGSGSGAGPGRVAAAMRGAVRRTVLGTRSWWAQLVVLRVAPAALALATIGMLVSWLADIGVLGASYAALGVEPPWAGLLLAYCAGQIASSVPITPGGIGVVEGSLTLALVAFGGSTETTLAAVLLYRLISHWACVPAGGVTWLLLRLTGPKDDPEGDVEPASVGASAARPGVQAGPR